MKKYLVILLSLCTFSVLAQRVATDYGDVYYDFFQFKEAARYYEEALLDKRVKKKQYLYEQLSQCYKYQFQYVKAEEYFEKVMTSGEPINPEFYIDYGNVLKLNGKYKEAKAQFKKYQEVTGTDLADPYIRSVNWAIRTADTVKNYTITQTDLNISGQSLGYCFYGNGIIYAHARNKTPIGKDMAPLFDLDYARKMNPTEFQADMDILSQLQFDLNEGSPCVSADQQTLYFSANSTNVKKRKKRTVGTIEVSEEGVSNFKIYAAQSEGGLFQDPVELSFNNNEFSCVHPFIMEDGTTLLFSSNMPGGFGGFDLYKSILQPNGKWGEPINLGKNVNTEENELFPWVSENMLYFSSKGFNNYGGYDIYVAKLTKSVMPIGLKNLGKPINSFRDDVAFITNDGGRTGYFSTNRNNDDGNDHVYYFKENEVAKFVDIDIKLDSLPDTLFTLESAPPVQEVKKADVETKTGEQEKAATVTVPSLTKTPPVAAVTTPVVLPKKVNDKKSLQPKKEPAKSKTIASNVAPAKEPKTATVSAVLLPDEQLTKLMFTPITFAFNQSDITVPQMDAADSVVALMKSNPDVKAFVAAYADSRGSFEYNVRLCEKRASSVKTYLNKKGIPSHRIITKGLGEIHLLNECADGVECTEEQHAVNRRVELKLVK